MKRMQEILSETTRPVLIRAIEFPSSAQEFNISDVPHGVINARQHVADSLPEAQFLIELQ